MCNKWIDFTVIFIYFLLQNSGTFRPKSEKAGERYFPPESGNADAYARVIISYNVYVFYYCWVQPPVTFPIGDHVNVLHDYKKTGPSKILKLLTCRCHHLIDMLIECNQSLVLVTHLKCLNVPYPSMFTNVCMNYYAHVPCCEKIAKNRPAY